MTQNCEFLFGYTNLVVNGVIVLLIVLSFVVHKFRQLQEAELTEQNDRLLLLSTQDVCYRFSLDQMQRATSNFHDELVIGKGGFGNVYKGTFKIGPTIVAIKRLHSRSRQGSLEFRTEIEMLSKFRHSHLVSLIGYCDDDCEMILVYEFMPGGTLADHLYKSIRKGDKSTPTLSWVQRLKVCIGAARGLDYLHTGTGIQHRIIHRDVKTTNILLDENLAAKISDFGLSKRSPANQATTDVSTHVKGTFGYLDPYYFSTRRLTKKSDVYSFGVVLLEVLCGRPAVDRTLDTEQMGLAGWAQHCFKEGLLGNIIDPKIKDEASPDCIEAFVKVAIQCLQFGPKHRPNMAEVVVALESALVLQEKIDEYILPEIIMSDDHQDDIDFSKLDGETTDSEKRTIGVSKGSHPEKQSSTRMTFTDRVIVYKGHMQNFVQALRGRRKIRGKNFKRNEGLLFTQQVSSRSNVDTRLFTSKELDMATDHYNEDRILRQGGQATVYKGMLTDGRIVAVKKCKMEDEYRTEQFIKEVVLLSNINHPNIVKLHGCCLETAVPLMVYEFIPNGTLFQYIHDDYNEYFPLIWDIRVRVAIEIAGALFYLHTSIPIYHRNIKSANILLDEKYRAKMAGFGTSISIAIDQTHRTTRVQGTIGYLDPEYFESSQFTDKSDVYSFGVVLLELLTGQKPMLASRLDNEVRTLATHFILAMEEDRIFDILDPRIAKEGREEEITAFANIAYRCLNRNGKGRPTMKQVAEELESIKLSKRLPISEQQYEEIENPVSRLNGHWDLTSTSTSSSY